MSQLPQDVEEFIASESYYDPEHPKSSEHDYILVDDLRAWMAGHVRVPVEQSVCLQEHCQSLIDRHGSVREAAKRIGIDHAYLYRLAKGEVDGPSTETLSKLGLVAVTRYFAQPTREDE